ncbi:MAG: hypothetical protein JNJ73_05415 [Hyphomonadaceae bacterium]|nr:hypothetical protein [Hyphomonadaceae bacterium]
MRLGWIVSIVAHALAVLVTLISWPVSAANKMDVGNVVPIEIVTLAPQTSVAPIASQEPEEQAVQEAAPEEETAPEPAPEPTPAPRPQQPSLNDFLSDVTSLLQDKQKDKQKARPRQTEGERGERPRARAGLGQAEAAALNDRLIALMRSHMRRNRCWRAPADLPNPERLIVTVRVRLDARGRLNGEPQLVSPTSTFGDPPMRAAADAALRAVLACDPFPFADDPVAADHYEVWRDMEFTFDPSQLSG